MALEVQIRLAKGSDLNFIYSTWLDSFNAQNCFGKMFGNGMFYRFYRSIIDKILAQDKTIVSVMTPIDEPDLIVAYAVYERKPATLHYIYTKGPYQRLGLARELLNTILDGSLIYTHQTEVVKDILPKIKNRMFTYQDLFKGETHAPRTTT